MAALVAVVAALCTPPRAIAQRVPVFEHERDMYISAGRFVPQWSGTLIVGFEDNLTNAPLVDAIDRDLNRDGISFEIPGANLINIRGVGGGFDGSILVGGNAFSGDSRRAGFIAWIPPDRRRRTLIQTEPFRPEAVVMAADGVIWAAGLIWDGKEGRNNTHSVVQRYDTTGKLLSSLQVPGAKSDSHMAGMADGSSHLLASKNRVGWLTNGYEYVEFSLDGTMLDRFDGPQESGVVGFAGWGLSAENQVVLGLAIGNGSKVMALDRVARSWAPMPLPGHQPGEWVRVIGFDGATLAVDKNPGIIERLKQAGAVGRKQ
jgi:hypothetical protein